MTLKLSPNGRFDALDREEFRSMIESDPFKAFMTRVAAEHKRNVQDCVLNRDQLELLRAQGAALALETVLHLPERILDEMTTKLA